MSGTLAIDVGGTFTDVTFADAATGASWVAKTPSTPADLSAGFIAAIRKVLALARRDIPRHGNLYDGVVLDATTGEPDKTATEAERVRRAGTPALIDRGPGFSEAEARWRAARA